MRSGYIRYRSVITLDITRLYDITFLPVRAEGTECKVCCLRNLQRYGILGRFQCRNTSVSYIVDIRTRISTSDLHRPLPNKCICRMKSFQVRNTIVHIHDIQARKLVYHTSREIFPVHIVRIAPPQFSKAVSFPGHTGEENVESQPVSWKQETPA